MKLLKSTLFTILLLFCVSNTFSQGFYLSAGCGYAFGQKSYTNLLQNYSYNGSRNLQTGVNYDSEEIEAVPFSFGKGFNFGLSVGYMFNDFIGIDMGLSYLVGGVTESNYSYTYSDIDNAGMVTKREVKAVDKVYCRMLRVIPSVVLTPNFEKWNPYARLGVVFGFGSFNMDYESTSYAGNTSIITTKSEFSDGFALGFNGVLGLNFVINERVSVFGEANYIGMSYAPKKYNLTERSIDGVDQVPNLDTYQKEIEFVDSYVFIRDEVDEDQPDKQLKISTPFSSIGINFGVKLNL